MKKGKKYILITLSGILIIAAIVAVCSFMPIVSRILELRSEAREIVRQGDTDDFKELRTSIVYDNRDEIIMTYSGQEDIYYAELSEIPQVLQDAFIVMEDRNFYKHRGIDLKAVMRAMAANYDADGIVQGASTITQQLARNIYLNQDVNWERKIKEAFIALELEKKYDKDMILEFYLNNIYFGHGYYGIESAAEGYFGKSAKELTVGESIFLSAIPNNPSRYDPIANEADTVIRARRILDTLYNYDRISDVDYLILNGDEENPFVSDINWKADRYAMNTNTADSYIYTYVTYCAVRYLMDKNGFVFRSDFNNEEEHDRYLSEYDTWYSYYQLKLFNGGYSIYTSLDMDAQKLLQENVDRVTGENDIALQAAAITVDNDTGRVIAVVGGVSENFEGFGINRAYQSFRQPGSAIKPLNVYGPYLSAGHSTEEKVYDVYEENGPKNAGGAYGGEITIADAVKYSKNTIAWQIYRYLSPEKCTDYLIRMNFKKVYPDKKYLAGALGGFTYGVSVEEMAAGFRTICNDGVYNQPTCIRAMHDKKTEYEEYKTEDIVIYGENASRLLTKALEGVLEDGTGKRQKLTAHTAAGKTGTTNNNKDMWFAGYTAYYTTAVWVGYDTPGEIAADNGNLAGTIWHDYMDLLHVGLHDRTFKEPGRVEAVENSMLYTGGEYMTGESEENQVFEDIWDNDMDAPETGGDPDARITAGDEDAGVSGEDENAGVTGGDADASGDFGDKDADILILE